MEINRCDPILQWYALYTRSRHEKFIEAELGKRSIEAFLPTRKVKRRWSDRTVTIEEPLFKSYIFVKTDFMTNRLDVLKIKGAVKFVSAGVNPISVEDSVVDSLKRIIQFEIPIDPFPYLDKGDRVCVKSGPFAGTEGYIVQKDNKKCQLVISISAIKSSISVKIDSYLVEKA